MLATVYRLSSHFRPSFRNRTTAQLSTALQPTDPAGAPACIGKSMRLRQASRTWTGKGEENGISTGWAFGNSRFGNSPKGGR